MFAITKFVQSDRSRLIVGHPDLVCSYWSDGILRYDDIVIIHEHGLSNQICSGAHYIADIPVKNPYLIEICYENALTGVKPNPLLMDGRSISYRVVDVYHRIPLFAEVYDMVERLMYDVFGQVY